MLASPEHAFAVSSCFSDADVIEFVIGASNHRGYEQGEFLKVRGERRVQTRDRDGIGLKKQR